MKISRWRFQDGGVEQGFLNYGEKNQRLNYDLGELDVVKEVARTPNKVLLATCWVYLFCEDSHCESSSFVCFSHFSSRSREKSSGGLYLDLVHPRVLSFVAQSFIFFLSMYFPSFKALWQVFCVFSFLISYLSLVQIFCQLPGLPGLQKPGNLLQKPFFLKHKVLSFI